MKFLHCADIHLGSKMEAKLPKDKADQRRAELCAAFKRMLEYAEKNKIQPVLLSGDVFDSDRPSMHDKQFFYSAVKAHPDIDFLYLRGNHDSEEAYTEYGLENLKTFSDRWTKYTYGNTDIYGLELGDRAPADLYTSLAPDKARKNVVMLHGGPELINIAKLRDKGIDYLALGHIHSYRCGEIDSRGIYVYSGCLEGRGFDETGEKGFVEADTDGGVTHRFIGNSHRIIEEVHVDISGAKDAYEAAETAKKHITCREKDLVRLVLEGEIAFDGNSLENDLTSLLAGRYYFVSVKNKTVPLIDIADIQNELSLRGEFVRSVLADTDHSEDEKKAIISVGLRAIGGEI